MSGDEPTTGWEAQPWDEPAHPFGAEQERAGRLARLVPADDDPGTTDDAPEVDISTTDDTAADEQADEQVDEHAAAAELTDPVVPDEVETTVPIGAARAGEAAAEELDEPLAPQVEDEPDAEADVEPEPTVTAVPPATDAWRDLQVQFVDDPAGAVDGAVALVRQAVEDHAGAAGFTDTEHLRQAFTRLRDLHARLTGHAGD